MKIRTFWLAMLIISFSTNTYSQILTGVDPNEGEQCQRLTLTVTGENTNFYQGTSSLWLDHDGFHIGAASETVINPNQIVGEFFFNPQQPIGNYDVHASNGTSADLILEDGFLLTEVVDLPILISNEPDSANTGETILMDIIGNYTHFATSGVSNTVYLNRPNGGHVSASSINVIDEQHMEVGFYFNVYKPAGFYDLHVMNQLDGEMIIDYALELIDIGNSPEIVSVEPNSGSQGESLTLTVTGRNTMFQQGSSMLKLSKTGLGIIYATGFDVVNDTVLTGDFIFYFDHNPGVYDVTVIDYDLGDATLIDGFELLASAGPPSLLSINPDTALQGTAVTFLINSENTHFDTEGNSISVTLKQGLEELYGHNINVLDSVTFEVDFVFSYANNTGSRELIVHSLLDGTMILQNCFILIETEPNASIVSVVPDSANQGDNITISVTGKNIIFMQGTSNLSLSMGSLTLFPSSEEVLNDTVINGQFEFLNTFPIGEYDVNVINDYAWPDVFLFDGFTLKLFTLIDEEKPPSMLTVYPNPSNGLLNVKRNFKDSGEFLLEVYDINGRFILEDRIGISENEKQLNLTTLSKGTYLLRVKFGDKEQTEQFLIE